MKLSAVHLKILCCMVLSWTALNAGLITTNNFNDPQPLFTAHYPYAFLVNEHKNYIKGIYKTPVCQALNFSVMPFMQFAKWGTDQAGNLVNIGNLQGRLNLLATLPFNNPKTTGTCSTPPYTNTNTDLPCGQSFPEIYYQVRDSLLTNICTTFGGPATTPASLKTVQGLIEVQQSNTGYAQEIGIFDNHMKYRKAGARFNFEALLGAGFGFMICGGFASIHQSPALVDSTRFAETTPLYTSTGKIDGNDWREILGIISSDVMGNLQNLARGVNLDVNTFDQTSLEDVHADLFWRGVIPVQQNPQIIPGLGYERWAKYLAMPFVSIGATFASGKSKDPNILFSLPFGNNGSNAFRARAGICLDFYNTIELTGEVGVTHFGSTTVNNFRIPNNNYQAVFFPFGTPTTIYPGDNWHLALGMYAYNFESIVSAAVNYVFVHHGRDTLTILNHPSGVNCNPNAFNPDLLSTRSSWMVHLINGSLAFAISPHARLYILAQIPLARRNAYRSTTWAVSFEAGF